MDQRLSGEEIMLDNSDAVVAKMASLYADRLMADVVLVVTVSDSESGCDLPSTVSSKHCEIVRYEYPSHRLILCASSPVFKAMLLNNDWSEAHSNRVQLYETPSAQAVFEDFLKYFYTGRIALDFASVIPIISLADKYDVTDLMRVGLDFMGRNIATAAQRNQIVTWFMLGLKSAEFAHISQECRLFIVANFSLVSRTLDFCHMDLDCLMEFTTRNDLVVDSELEVFCACEKWLAARHEMMTKCGESSDYISETMDAYTTALLSTIRFPMMSPVQLADLMLTSLSTTHTDLLLAKIRHALAWHHADNRAVQTLLATPTASDSERRQYTPRLYTEAKFGTTVSVAKVQSLPQYAQKTVVTTCQRWVRHAQASQTMDWLIQIYPKGVKTDKGVSVSNSFGLEIPGEVLRTIRLTISPLADSSDADDSLSRRQHRRRASEHVPSSRPDHSTSSESSSEGEGDVRRCHSSTDATAHRSRLSRPKSRAAKNQRLSSEARRSDHLDSDLRVKIGILIKGCTQGSTSFEHVAKVVTRNFHFAYSAADIAEGHESVAIFDDVVDFHEINPVQGESGHFHHPSRKASRYLCPNSDDEHCLTGIVPADSDSDGPSLHQQDPFLHTNPADNKAVFKLVVSLTPLTDLSSVAKE